MDNKRILTESKFDYYANMGDLEWEEFVDSESDNYEPSDNSSDCEAVYEYKNTLNSGQASNV